MDTNVSLTDTHSGGGISGLAFAIALARSGANVDVDIYKSTATFGEVGAGIGFFPRILDDLRFLGFGDDIEEKSLGGQTGCLACGGLC